MASGTGWFYSKDNDEISRPCSDKGGVRECTEEIIGNGENYRGCQRKTVSGRDCQKWSMQRPHEHSDLTDENHNLCRNPGGSKSSIGCYTSDPDRAWEACSPMKMFDENVCQSNDDTTWVEQCAFTFCGTTSSQVTTAHGAAITEWSFAECSTCFDNYCTDVQG